MFTHVAAVLEARHGLLEGPSVLGDEIAFSDVVYGGVYAAAPDGSARTLLERRRGIGGLAATDAGDLVVSGRDLSLLSADGTLRTLYADPDANVSSVCFAGDRIVVTTADNLEMPDTGGSLLTAPAPVPGAPVPLAQV